MPASSDNAASLELADLPVRGDGRAANTMTVLKTLLAVAEGAVGADLLLAVLKQAIHFDRAVILANSSGGTELVASEPSIDARGAFEDFAVRGFLEVTHLAAGDDKTRAGLSSLVAAEECALLFPLSLGRRIAVAALMRRAGKAAFSEEELTAARVFAAASLSRMAADVQPAGAAPQTGGTGNMYADIQDQRLFKVILDHLPIGLTVQDSSGRFILANAMAAADLAVSAERLVGCSPGDFLSPEDALSRREWERSVTSGGKTITAETVVADHEGPRVLLTSHTPVFITNNNLLISSSVDITEHREIERRLSERAHIDKLTGLPDRVRIQEYAEQVIREHTPFALAFIDLDNFKHVNDYYSHAIGDAVLIKIGERISAKLRPGDMLARISGDEFVLLLQGVDDRESAAPSIAQVLSDLKQPFYIEGFEIFSSCSIGVSFYPAHGDNYEVLRRNADGAMYGAKGRAKGQAMYFDDGLGKKIAARMEAEQRLRLAIRDRRFVCAFQPKVDIHSHEVVGFETLVRWRDSDGEIHMPGQFISLAVELGLINPITNFVLNETLASIDQLDAAFGPGKSVSINIGAKQTGDLAFMHTVIDTIKSSGHADRLVLELTEDAIIEQGVFQSEILPFLRKLGVKISIDDFGTGYSSLSALADITADELKIDRSFITRIHERPRSQGVLKAIESLGHTLGMDMVAEGVESAEELIYLQTATRIRFAQGFYFSKPVYLDDVRSGAMVGGRTMDTRNPAIQDRISGRLRAPASARSR